MWSRDTIVLHHTQLERKKLLLHRWPCFVAEAPVFSLLLTWEVVKKASCPLMVVMVNIFTGSLDSVEQICSQIQNERVWFCWGSMGCKCWCVVRRKQQQCIFGFGHWNWESCWYKVWQPADVVGVSNLKSTQLQFCVNSAFSTPLASSCTHTLCCDYSL